MAVTWPTHRAKATHAKAQRRAKRKRDSKLAKVRARADREATVSAV